MDKAEVSMRPEGHSTNTTSDCSISATEVSSVQEDHEQSQNTTESCMKQLEHSGKWWLKFKTLDSEETRNALKIEWMRRGLHQSGGSVKDKVQKFESLSLSSSSSPSISQSASSLMVPVDVGVSDIASLMESGTVERISEAKAIDAIERSLNVRRVKILEQEGKLDEAEALRGEMNLETKDIVGVER